MRTPVLDPRSKEDIMASIARRAAEYVPEWRYDGDASDPGAALAALFGELFYQTVDRYNALPQKTYTEFLNLLGVQMPPPTPASGFLQFGVHDVIDRPVPVPEGTGVFAADENGDNIVFETERRVEATPARLKAVFYADPREGVIQRLDMAREQPFFTKTEGENLQRHRLCLCQNDVLSVTGPCTVEVGVRMRARFLEDAAARKLADPSFARWSWFDGEKDVPFDAVRREGSTLILEKKAPGALAPDGEGHICVSCDMGAESGEIELTGVTLRSVPAAEERADALANNDIPIPQPDGGYCFGRIPMPWQLFYIRSDRVFRKRGAEAMLHLDVAPVPYTEVDSAPQYQYGKRIIDKNDAVVIKPDDVYVDQVVWEYYNGVGWANLPVSGNRNPFSGKSDGPLNVTFRVPEDMAPVEVNAQEGYHIRARVVNVANAMSLNPRWILPFVKEVSCTWQYPGERRADWVSAANNGRTECLENAALCGDLGFTAYSNLEDHPRSMYLCFDGSPHGMPLSLLFQILGSAAPEGKLTYEAWTGSRFELLRAVDRSRNMAHTGQVFLYIPDPLPEREFFGETGCFLRVSLSTFSPAPGRFPTVCGILLNTVPAVQQQTARKQYFSTEAYDAGKTVTLLYTPVLRSDVWVDEGDGIASAEVLRLEAECPGDIRCEREGNELRSCWIRWKQVPLLAMAGPEDRVYELDAAAGKLTFGDGKRGRVPPEGFRNMEVATVYGGGSRGNLPAGAVTEFLRSVPLIDTLTNITPMSGGTDGMPMARLENLGNKRLRHRGRAVGVADYEELVSERFGQAVHVKCFTGLDEAGRPAPGHVCLVVQGLDLDGERMGRDLCREIYDYLAERCDCCMAASGRLHVRPSTDLTVNVSVAVRLRDPDRAAETQQAISDRLDELIARVWRARDIGRQINVTEVYQTVKAVPNVAAISRVFLEGVYFEAGRQRMTAIEDDSAFPYATVTAGRHTVRIS